jgi:hypothetical protein
MIPPGVRKGGERRRWPDEVGSFGSPKGADAFCASVDRDICHMRITF